MPIGPICIGAGYTSGRKVVFENCVFECYGNTEAMFYAHTHGTYNLSDCYLSFESCAFITENKTAITYQNADKSKHGGKLNIRNCWFANGITIRLFGGNGTVLFGGGNSDVIIKNQNNSKVYLTQSK